MLCSRVCYDTDPYKPENNDPNDLDHLTSFNTGIEWYVTLEWYVEMT